MERPTGGSGAIGRLTDEIRAKIESIFEEEGVPTYVEAEQAV